MIDGQEFGWRLASLRQAKVWKTPASKKHRLTSLIVNQMPGDLTAFAFNAEGGDARGQGCWAQAKEGCRAVFSVDFAPAFLKGGFDARAL